MTDRRLPIAQTIRVAVAAIVLTGGARAIAAETCSWTKTPSGADFGTCADSSGKAYCVTCQYAPRVCVRTPC